MALLIVLLPLSLWAGSNGADIHLLADRVDAHYNHLQTMQADFTEIYIGAGVTRTESGVLWLKRPGRMRWEYHQPREKLFLSDGRSAWFFVPGERQVRRTTLKKLDDLHTPLAYLLGHTRLEKEFTALSLATDVTPEKPEDLVLRAVPRRLTGVQQVLLEVAPQGSLSRIVVFQEDGSTTDIRFSNQIENLVIPEAKFHFTVPPLAESIDVDQLGQ